MPSRNTGKVKTTLTQKRRDMSRSSGFSSSNETVRGSSAMPQIGHVPGWSRTIWGCTWSCRSRSRGLRTRSCRPWDGRDPRSCHRPGPSRCGRCQRDWCAHGERAFRPPATADALAAKLLHPLFLAPAVEASVPGAGPANALELVAQCCPGAVQLDPCVVDRDARRAGYFRHARTFEIHTPEELYVLRLERGDEAAHASTDRTEKILVVWFGLLEL